MQQDNPATKKRGLSPGQGDEAGPSKMAKVPTVECLTCCEMYPASSTFTAACSHNFCQECLQKFFRESLQEAKFPAKCCDQPVPETAYQYLPPDLVDNLRRKKIEYAIPVRKRVFCPGCGSIILPANIDKATKTGSCADCNSVTCTQCKNFDHEGPCRRPSEDKAVEELKKLSRVENWVACYKCGQTIEKAEDCDHITCVCGAQFCYQCGAKWKTCNCFHPEFTLTGPVNRNFRRTHLQASPEPEVDETPDDHIEPITAAQIIRETELSLAIRAPRPPPLFPKRDWNCKHENRRRIRWNGPYNCADCPNIQPSFIWECRACKIMLCGRCVKLYGDWDYWEGPLPGRAKGWNENRGINGGVSGQHNKKKKKNPREGRKGSGQWRKDAKDVLEGNFGK